MGQTSIWPGWYAGRTPHVAHKHADLLQAELRSQLEARLAAVSERVGALAQREAKQEKKRGGWRMLRGRPWTCMWHRGSAHCDLGICCP